MNFRRSLIPIAIVGLFALLVGMGAKVWDELRRLSIADGGNLQWTIMQIDSETARLHAALLEQAARPEPDDFVVEMRTNIALSRIALVQEGNARGTFSDDPEAVELLDRLSAFANAAAAEIDAEPGLTRATLMRLLDLTRAVRPDARRLALIGVRLGAEYSEDQRHAFSSQLRSTGIVAFVLIAALSCSLLVLDRLLRIADQRRRDLQVSGARLSSTVSASLDAIVTTDPDGRVEDFNPAAEAMFNWSQGEIRGRSINDTVMPVSASGGGSGESLVRDPQYWVNLTNHGRVEITARRRDGEEFPAELSARAIQESGLGLVIWYIRDISERKIGERRLVEARNRAERMDRAKTRFLTIMSHEMRTPLNGILGLLDLMLSRNTSPEHNRHVEVAIGSAEILLQLTNDALDVTRIEAGSLDLADEPFNPSDILAQTVELLEPLAAKQGLTLELQVEPGMDRLFKGDGDRIRQIVTNLIGNGIKFTSVGKVTVRLSGDHQEDRTQTRISVTDTGAGIPGSQSDAIFDDFVALPRSRGRTERGDGLGLSISRQIARLMRGDLLVQSTEGEGSTFTLLVPLEHAGDAQIIRKVRAHDGPVPQPIVGQRCRVLVSEDDAFSQSVIVEMLEVLGHDVTLVSDGAQCVLAAGSQAFDLIIMDIAMPVLDGLAATRLIRSRQGPNQKSRILGLTAHGPQEFRAKADAAGMSDFKTKPIRMGALRDLFSERRCDSATPGDAARDVLRDVYSELVATLGAPRVKEFANRLRAEMEAAAEDIQPDPGSWPAAEIRLRMHRLRGAAVVLGFAGVAGMLDGLREQYGEASTSFSSEDAQDFLMGMEAAIGCFDRALASAEADLAGARQGPAVQA